MYVIEAKTVLLSIYDQLSKSNVLAKQFKNDCAYALNEDG